MNVNMNGFMDNSFGIPQDQLNDLVKAMGTGTQENGQLGNAYVDGYGAVRVQSLETTVKHLPFQAKQIVFWNDLPKSKAFNTIEEYNVLESYGGDTNGFTVEGGMPFASDAKYVRKDLKIKWMGCMGEVTHPATLVRSSVGDLIGRTVTDKSMEMLGKIERSLVYADSSIDDLEFDGLAHQLELNGNILDLRGAPLDQDIMEDVARISFDKNGMITHFYCNATAKTDLVRQILPMGRWSMPASGGAASLGIDVEEMITACGRFQIKQSVFLKDGSGPITTPLISAPAAPAAVTLSVAHTVADSLFQNTETHFYAVSSMSPGGESVVCAAASIGVVAGDSVTLNVTSVPAGTTAYKIFRGTSATTLKEIRRVKAVAGNIYVDKNFDLPGTSKAFALMVDANQGLSFKQLAPMMKMDLAMLTPSFRFLVLMYGALAVYTPQKMVLVKNIGKL
jgi:hypothetical protein